MRKEGKMAEKITVLITEEEIDRRVRELAAQISKDYEGRKIRMVGILKGASFFMCELAKRITVPVSIDFMQVSSYGGATESTGTVRIRKDLDESIEGLDVIIVEDIVDSGRSLNRVLALLEQASVASVAVASLLLKPSAVQVDLDSLMYVGFEIEPEFVVGYGLDYNGQCRNLPHIYRHIGTQTDRKSQEVR